MNQQKSKIASELHAYSDAARRAAGRLDEEGDDNLAHYLRAAADRVDSFGSHLRDSKLGNLVNEVENVARRQPEVFFGAMFVAGLAIARFAKASRRKRMQDRVEFAASSRESGSSYFETQPVSSPAPSRVYPAPVPASTSPVTGPLTLEGMPL